MDAAARLRHNRGVETPEFQELAQRVLVKAAQKLNGAAELAAFLQVSEASLALWIAGHQAPPSEIILKAFDLLVDEPASFWRETLKDQRFGRM